MSPKLFLVAAVLTCSAAPVMAAAPVVGLAPLKSIAAEQSPVEQVHGWHRKCRKDFGGWHRHVKGVGRVQCTTAKNCYTNMFGFRVCSWF